MDPARPAQARRSPGHSAMTPDDPTPRPGDPIRAPATPARTARRPGLSTPRAFRCQCGRPVFFRNSRCLACDTPLGYDPARRRLLPLEPSPRGEGLWRRHGGSLRSTEYRRCANLDSAAGCNWLVERKDDNPLCRCCRLTRTVPDLSVPENADWWGLIEQAKRRLVSSLVALGLPVRSRQVEDPDRGLAFDLLRAPPEGPPVTTGHLNGVITLDIQEADDLTREHRRTFLHEPYRTLLGHLRHEVGHYYWLRLVLGTPWEEPCRALFGDERADYAAALQSHYANGPPEDWRAHFVSAYASAHPAEDWAETWAHYLHVVDTIDTATAFGLDTARVGLVYERFPLDILQDESAASAEAFMGFLTDWMELTGVLNELSRSMGLADFYPFILSAPAVRKLHFVHRVVQGAFEARTAPRPGGRRQSGARREA